jgi:hypothetical protein
MPCQHPYGGGAFIGCLVTNAGKIRFLKRDELARLLHKRFGGALKIKKVEKIITCSENSTTQQFRKGVKS